MKTCSACRVEQPEANFWPDRRRGHLMARCKSCKTVAAKQYRASRPGIHKDRYWANPIGERERHLVRKYGVSLARYDEMLAEQNGCCAICRRAQDRALDVDHDHSTGAVRGLLCTNCNRMVGHAADDPARLDAAAAYLRRTKP